MVLIRNLKYQERDVVDIERDGGWKTYEELTWIFSFIDVIDFTFTTGEEEV